MSRVRPLPLMRALVGTPASAALSAALLALFAWAGPPVWHWGVAAATWAASRAASSRTVGRTRRSARKAAIRMDASGSASRRSRCGSSVAR